MRKKTRSTLKVLGFRFSRVEMLCIVTGILIGIIAHDAATAVATAILTSIARAK